MQKGLLQGPKSGEHPCNIKDTLLRKRDIASTRTNLGIGQRGYNG